VMDIKFGKFKCFSVPSNWIPSDDDTDYDDGGAYEYGRYHFLSKRILISIKRVYYFQRTSLRIVSGQSIPRSGLFSTCA
jgi:hypothetical protein